MSVAKNKYFTYLLTYLHTIHDSGITPFSTSVITTPVDT